MSTKRMVEKLAASLPAKLQISSTERAFRYIEGASRIRVQDVRDNPGAKTQGHAFSARYNNQAGHTIGELQHAAKPPIGWIWGDFFKPWFRIFAGDRHFNGDVNLRREYTPLTLLELQRLIDLGWFRTDELIDLTQLCNTGLIHVDPTIRQFGINLLDGGEEIFQTPINIEVQWASQTTIAAVEKAGGRIRLAYYDLESLKALADPRKFFLSGKPLPRRKRPPHSLLKYYMDPKNRGYLADDDECEAEAKRLAELCGYERHNRLTDAQNAEKKHPDQIFLGLQPGSIVSLADRKVFRPTHPVLRDYYGNAPAEADHLH